MKLSPRSLSNTAVHMHMWILYLLSITALIVGIISIVRTMHSKESYVYNSLSGDSDEDSGILLQKNGNSLEIQSNLIAKDLTLTQSTGKLVNTVIFSKQSNTLAFKAQSGMDLTDSYVAKMSPKTLLSQLFKPLTYTPQLSNSYLLLTVHVSYLVDGYGEDGIESYVYFQDTSGQHQGQYWGNASGGGTRSGTIFPLTGMYVNKSTSPIEITIGVNNYSTDDVIQFMTGDPYQYFAVLQEFS